MFLLPLRNESESRTKGSLFYIEDVFIMNTQSNVYTFKLSIEKTDGDKTSQIFYSQDSILNRFGDYTRHANMNIGETLDYLLVGRCNVDDILTMNVMKMNGSG
jgi:hypothetical protein